MSVGQNRANLAIKSKLLEFVIVVLGEGKYLLHSLGCTILFASQEADRVCKNPSYKRTSHLLNRYGLLFGETIEASEMTVARSRSVTRRARKPLVWGNTR